jgi:hypothetical protein
VQDRLRQRRLDFEGAVNFRDMGGYPALTTFAADTRAREAAPIPPSSDAGRPAPAGGAALRLLADVDISFLAKLLVADSGWTMELG